MTLTQWNTILSHIGDFVETLPLIPFLLLSKAKKREYRFLGIYFFIGASLKLVSYFVASKGINSLFIYHLLALVEFTFLFAFLTQFTTYKQIKVLTMLIVWTINIVASTRPDALQQFNSMPWTINTLILICACFYSLYGLYTHSYKSWHEVRPQFTVVSGLLIYLTGSLFTYILGWQILSKVLQGFFANGWIINSISNLIKDFTVAAGLFLLRLK